MIGGITMKKILSIIFIISLTACSSSKYVMQELDEPVRNIYTENFYAYIYKPKGHTDEEFKEFFNIDPDVDISLENFRLLYLAVDLDTIPDFSTTLLHLIDTKENDYYIAYLLHHLYQINDVNIIFEQSDGEIVRIQ